MNSHPNIPEETPFLKKITPEEYLIQQKYNTRENIEKRIRARARWERRIGRTKSGPAETEAKGYVTTTRVKKIEKIISKGTNESDQKATRRRKQRVQEMIKRINKIEIEHWLKIYNKAWKMHHKKLAEQGIYLNKNRRENREDERVT